MKSSSAPAQPTSWPRKALAEQLTHIADLRAHIGGGSSRSARQPEGERIVDAAQAPEHAGLQQLLSAPVAKRDELIAAVLLEDELPRRIRAYQALVLQVNAALNDILAFDDAMRRRFPARASIFNTPRPHERAVRAPSTDRSPLPPLKIDSRELSAAARKATDRFVDALASDAEARFGRS
jgi:hypothetical protein